MFQGEIEIDGSWTEKQLTLTLKMCIFHPLSYEKLSHNVEKQNSLQIVYIVEKNIKNFSLVFDIVPEHQFTENIHILH